MKNELIYKTIQKYGIQEPDLEVNHPVTYSQDQEDKIISSFFSAVYPEYSHRNITYLDIGCNHPIATSNTFLFYSIGARGVLVEPNPKFYDMITRVRPKDTLIKAAIGPNVSKGEISIQDLYIPEHSEIASLDPLFIDSWYKKVKNENNAAAFATKVTTDIYNINDIYLNHVDQDKLCILDIDVEGIDFELFKSLEINNTKIVVVVIELSSWSFTDPRYEKEVIGYFKAQGFTLYSKTWVNHIFVRTDTIV